MSNADDKCVADADPCTCSGGFCSAKALLCDGPEDCKTGEECCTSSSFGSGNDFAQCKTACSLGEQELCHTSTDCSSPNDPEAVQLSRRGAMALGGTVAVRALSAAACLLLALTQTGCPLPSYHVREAMFGQAKPPPFSTLFVRRVEAGEMLEVGFDHSDRDDQRPWIEIGTRTQARFNRTFRAFGQGNHRAFHHGAVGPGNGAIYAVAAPHGTYHVAVVALSSRGDVRWAVETPLLPAPTFGHPSVVVGADRVWVLVGLREGDRRSLLVASVGTDGRGQAATIVRGSLEGRFPTYPLATRFDTAVASDRGLTLAVAETGRRAPWIARFSPAAELVWMRELRGPACLEAPEAPALDVTPTGDTVIALRARCGRDPVPDLVVARVPDDPEIGWLTILHRVPPPGWPPRGARNGVPGFGPFTHALAAEPEGGAIVATTLPAAANGNTRLAVFGLDPTGAVASQRALAGSASMITSVHSRGPDVVVSTLDVGDCVLGRHDSACGDATEAAHVVSRREALRTTDVEPSSERFALEWVDVREQLGLRTNGGGARIGG